MSRNLSDIRTPAGAFALPYSVRHAFERFFQADLSLVRVHIDGRAAIAGARAFACGSDLHFAPGEYHPSTPIGRALLAHELAHVLQQHDSHPGRALRPTILNDPRLEAEAERAADLWLQPGTFTAHFSVQGRTPSGACVQMAAAPQAQPQEEDQRTQWGKIVQMLSSKQALGAIGVIGTGALLWYYRDDLVTKGVKLGAKAVAAVGSKMFTPTAAANFVLNKFAESLDKAPTSSEHLMIAVKGYASLVIPGGNLVTTALFQGIKVRWNGISPLQSFAMQVFAELPPDWRNQFATECVKGMAAISVGMYIQGLNTVATVLSSPNNPWG